MDPLVFATTEGTVPAVAPYPVAEGFPARLVDTQYQGIENIGHLVTQLLEHSRGQELLSEVIVPLLRSPSGADIPTLIGGVGYTLSSTNEILLRAAQNLEETRDALYGAETRAGRSIAEELGGIAVDLRSIAQALTRETAFSPEDPITDLSDSQGMDWIPVPAGEITLCPWGQSTDSTRVAMDMKFGDGIALRRSLELELSPCSAPDPDLQLTSQHPYPCPPIPVQIPRPASLRFRPLGEHRDFVIYAN